MAPQRRILVVETDRSIAETLRLHLGEAGFCVRQAEDDEDGLALLGADRWDAAVLQLRDGGADGLAICRRARAVGGYTPIIVTSEAASETQRILGLELGADDVLAKPFSTLELVARIKALVRRAEAAHGASAAGYTVLAVGDLRIDAVSREVTLGRRRITLTLREFDLLSFFARHAGKVFSRAELLDRVWGYRHQGYEHTVNTHINRLRAKIEATPARPRRIVTVWGVGYKFVVES